MKNKKVKFLGQEITTREYIIWAIVFVILWRVPLLIWNPGAIASGLLAGAAFLISSWIVKLLKRRKNAKK